MHFYLRELLRNADDGQNAGAGGGASGDAVTFTPEQQVKINAIQAADRRKHQQVVSELQTKLTEYDKRFADFEAEKAKAAEEAELKGKTEAEKAQIQFRKAEERAKTIETELAKTRADYDAKLKTAADVSAAKTKRYGVMPAIASGAAEGAAATALREFLASADVKLDEAGEEIASITYEGKTFEKVQDAVKAFFDKAPFLAKPPAGGSGSHRGTTAPLRGKGLADLTPEQALSGLFGS